MNHFLNDLVPIVAILAVFGIPAAVIIVIAVLRHRQKMLIIGRGCGSPDDFPAPYCQTPLLWGMVITAVSVAGVISASVQREPDFAVVSILALASGLALLLYWLISAPQRRREKDLYERKFPTGGVPCPMIHTGAPLLWYADRQPHAPPSQLPPRNTRNEPAADPVGSSTDVDA